MNSRAVFAMILAMLSLGCAPAQPPAQGQTEDESVKISVKASKDRVAPGDTLPIAVVLDIEPSWHIHTNAPVLTPGMREERFDPTPTEVSLTGAPEFSVWPTQWPKPESARVIVSDKIGPEMYGVFAGRTVVYLPIRVPASAKPGTTLDVPIRIAFQACDERNCHLPVDTMQSVTLTVVEPSAAGAPSADPLFKPFDPLVFGTPPISGTANTVKFSAFGLTFAVNAAGAGFVVLLLVAAFGGLLLNFTPCVLPVIPLKIMGLSQTAGHPARCFFLGSVMSLGVVAFWIAIGAAIAFVSGFTAINSLFQTPWFSLAVGLFILLMAVGMLGAYAIRLPQAVYLINPSHESAPGSFVFGIMTAVLSTPCTAPFMGSAAAWAATQQAGITLATFGAIGVGMALPYLVLSAFPKLLSRMPRTGPASELIKQVMGLLMIGVAVFFLGTGADPLFRQPVDAPIRFFWWIIAAFGVGAMGLLVVRTWAITRRSAPRAGWTAFAVIFSAVTVLVAAEVTDRGPIPWIGFTPARLTEHLSQKQTVVLDFTAEWCLNCKALESAVLHRPEVVALLTRPDVVPMRVDLTGNNIPGKTKLKELNWVGIPLLVVYGPGLSEPIKYDAYTVDMVKDAIGRASGGMTASLPDQPALTPTAFPTPSTSSETAPTR